MGEVGARELRAGDILLLRSAGAAAWVARLFDGADVDRAALYLGEGRVAEAAGDAGGLRSLDECVGGSDSAVPPGREEAAPMGPGLGPAPAPPHEAPAAAPPVRLAPPRGS